MAIRHYANEPAGPILPLHRLPNLKSTDHVLTNKGSFEALLLSAVWNRDQFTVLTQCDNQGKLSRNQTLKPTCSTHSHVAA